MSTNYADDLFLETQYQRHIKPIFCDDCKFGVEGAAQCPKFLYGNGVCLQFKWKSTARKKKYEDEVLDNQASTIWIMKGTPLEKIWAMKREKLRSVLTPDHYSQFEKRDAMLAQCLKEALQVQQEAKKSQQQLTSAASVEKQLEKEPPKQPAPKLKVTLVDKLRKMRNQVDRAINSETLEPQYHYFHCMLPTGKEVTYKRNIKSASYESEVKSFRKYLAKQNIKIIKEEKK